MENQEPRNNLGIVFRSLQQHIEEIKKKKEEIASLVEKLKKDKESLETIKSLIVDLEKIL